MINLYTKNSKNPYGKYESRSFSEKKLQRSVVGNPKIIKLDTNLNRSTYNPPFVA